MSRRRDQHGRGLRGPLALPNPLSPRTPRPAQRAGKTAFFLDAVEDAVETISRQSPDALAGITVGVEDVPFLQTAWSGSQVPLAAALEATPARRARVAFSGPPPAPGAAPRRGLRILVYRTIVEQLAALTGRSVDEIDPHGGRDYDI